MAQIYLPEHPRERDQLQSSVSAPDVTLAPRIFERPPRRFGVLDLIIALVVLADVTLLVLAASRWAAKLSPVVHIQLIPGMLPDAELFSYVEERGIFRLEAPETQEEA